MFAHEPTYAVQQICAALRSHFDLNLLSTLSGRPKVNTAPPCPARLQPLKWANSLLIFLLAGNLVRRQVRIRLRPQAQRICESPVHFRCSRFAITDSRPRPERWQAQDVVGCL